MAATRTAAGRAAAGQSTAETEAPAAETRAEQGQARGTSPDARQPGIADMLVRLSHMVDHVFADVCRDADLTPQQAQLLCMLLEGPVGMTGLSRLLHLEKSSLSGLVDRVERRGLIARVRSDSDRRAYLVALTDAGSAVAAECHADMTAHLSTFTEALDHGEQDRLVSDVTRILAAHTAATGRPWNRTE